MGVTGCGKTTIGELLSSKTGIPFHDADHFHPEANINKMRDGIALNDDDRTPWLEVLANLLSKCSVENGCILACSALKDKYRKILANNIQERIYWIHLEGNFEILKERLKNRKGHFMNADLLQSQLNILEVPLDFHNLSIEHHPEIIVQKILEYIKK